MVISKSYSNYFSTEGAFFFFEIKQLKKETQVRKNLIGLTFAIELNFNVGFIHSMFVVVVVFRYQQIFVDGAYWW